jgi:hypothetical protein
MPKTIPCAVSWCCTDCIMLLANGEDPVDWSEYERVAWHIRIDQTMEGSEVTVGMLASEHADDCPVKITGDWQAVDECSCAVNSFSWSACDLCRSNLGGERHAITFWLPDESEETSDDCPQCGAISWGQTPDGLPECTRCKYVAR